MVFIPPKHNINYDLEHFINLDKKRFFIFSSPKGAGKVTLVFLTLRKVFRDNIFLDLKKLIWRK